MPALKVFERVPGARLLFRTRAKELWISAEIQIRGGSFTYRQGAKPDPSGRIEWTVPYAKVNRGWVYFPGTYEIRDGSGRKLATTPVVSEEAVLRGETITLPPHS